MAPTPRFRRYASGFSLIEVLIALGVLAVGLAAVLSHQFTIDIMRSTAMSRALQTVAVNNLVNLIDGTNWDELGRGQRPWSLSRVQGGSGTNPPLSLNDLMANRVVTGGLRGDELTDSRSGDYRFYVEYYRSTANLDAARNPLPAQPGLLDTPATSATGFRSAFATSAANCRIVPDPNLGLVDPTQLTQGNPVLMRIIVARADRISGGERTTYETFLGSQTAPQ